MPEPLAGGRCPLAAPAAPPARRGCLLKQRAARRGTAFRALDSRLRMGYGRAPGFTGVVGLGTTGLKTPGGMSGCDGFGLMDKMRDMRYRMPVILITGRTEGFTRDIALQKGAVGFLQKPFNEQSLLDLIEALEQEGDESL